MRKTTEALYKELSEKGVEVLIDDREDVRPGAKFADAELMGIPHRIVVGDRGLKDGIVEYANRKTGEHKELDIKVIGTLFS